MKHVKSLQKLIIRCIPWNLRLALKGKLEQRRQARYSIPFDFWAEENLCYAQEIQASLEKVLALSNQAEFNAFRAEFEIKFAKLYKAPAALGVDSGTSALVFSLLGLGVGKGDEVIVPVHTYISTVLAIMDTGATPVLVDVKDDLTLDPSDAEAKVTSKTKAIIPVHIYGYPADMDAILKIADKYHLGVVEDACQGHATKINGQPVGGIGDFGCFSFHWSKQICAPGDGGILICRRQKDAEKIARLREPIYKDPYVCLSHRTPSRLSPLFIPFLTAKLNHLSQDRLKREKLADDYDKELGGIEEIRLLPRPDTRDKHGWRNYTIRIKQRKGFREHLKKNGIETKVFYPDCLHLRPELSYLKCKPGDFPVYEAAQKEIISLPFSHVLDEQQAETVVRGIRSFYE